MLPFKSCFSDHEPGGSFRCPKVDVWGLISQVKVFKGGVPSLGFRPFSSQGAAGDSSFLPIVGHHAGSGVDGEPVSQPLLSTLMWAVCQMCRSCSEEETMPCVATDFMCPWEELSVVGSSLNENLDLFPCSHTHTHRHTHRILMNLFKAIFLLLHITSMSFHNTY